MEAVVERGSHGKESVNDGAWRKSVKEEWHGKLSVREKETWGAAWGEVYERYGAMGSSL